MVLHPLILLWAIDAPAAAYWALRGINRKKGKEAKDRKDLKPFELWADARNSLGQGLDLSRSALGVHRELISTLLAAIEHK